MRHIGNLSRNTKGTVGAQYGHVSSSSWGTVEAQLGQKAQYGHSMARFSISTVWAQSGHERVNFQKKFVFEVQFAHTVPQLCP